MKTSLLATVLGFAALVAACGSTTEQTAPPSVAASRPAVAASSSREVAAIVATLCAPPAYSTCAAGSAAFVEAMDAGALLAVCDYGNGTGDIVWIDSGDEADAEGQCSGDGLISPSMVVRVVRLPL